MGLTAALLVLAFWAGGQTWRARYSSGEEGLHLFRTSASDRANPDLHGVEGALEVRPYRGENPLYRHGPVRVAADRRAPRRSSWLRCWVSRLRPACSSRGACLPMVAGMRRGRPP